MIPILIVPVGIVSDVVEEGLATGIFLAKKKKKDVGLWGITLAMEYVNNSFKSFINMKKFIYLVVFTVSFAVLFGCSFGNGEKNDEKAFREDLLSKTIPEQVMMLHSLTPEDQYQYWIKKMDNTLASKNLSKEEKNVIRPVRERMTIDLYRYSGTEECDSFNELVEQTVATLKDEFDWDDYKLFKYFETILTEEEYNEYLKRNSREDLLEK